MNVALMNSPPLSECNSVALNGSRARMRFSARVSQSWARLGSARSSVQPVSASVAVRVQAICPRPLVPQWWTVSTSS